MRQLMTIRIDPDVLEAARGRAFAENRTLTNYIETVLRKDLGLMGLVSAPRHIRAAARSAARKVRGVARRRAGAG
jgi:hypothetical protein